MQFAGFMILNFNLFPTTCTTSSLPRHPPHSSPAVAHLVTLGVSHHQQGVGAAEPRVEVGGHRVVADLSRRSRQEHLVPERDGRGGQTERLGCTVGVSVLASYSLMW